MKIKISLGEINRIGDFNEFCDLKGLSPYCMNEGLALSSDEVELTIEEAKKCGLLKDSDISKEG